MIALCQPTMGIKPVQLATAQPLPTQSLWGLPPFNPGDRPELAVRETLKAMRLAILRGKKQPRIRQLALSLVSDLPSKHWGAEISRCFDYVQTNIRFVRDPCGVELIHTPEGILDDGQGDCDDHTILICSLLESIGHPTRSKAIGFSPGDFSHVYAQTRCGGSWLSLDTTEEYRPIGWQPPGIYDAMIIHNRRN